MYMYEGLFLRLVKIYIKDLYGDCLEWVSIL